MKVIEHFFDVKTGTSGVREVEAPDVISAAEGIARDAQNNQRLDEQIRLQELRERMINELLVGNAASAADRAEYRRLLAKEFDRTQ